MFQYYYILVITIDSCLP